MQYFYEIVRISDLVIDPRMQARGYIDKETVAEYEESLKEGAIFPPIDAIRVGDRLLVIDGFHRIAAFRQAGREEIEVRYCDGTEREAFTASLGTNSDHGRPRTNEEKRHAVTRALLDAEFATWSDVKVGELCRVSAKLVAGLRFELENERGPADIASVHRPAAKKTGPKQASRPLARAHMTDMQKPADFPRPSSCPGYPDVPAGYVESDASLEAVTPLALCEERCSALIDDLDRLEERLAVAAYEGTPEERALLVDEVERLKRKSRADDGELRTLKIGRAEYLNELNAMKAVIRSLERTIKKQSKMIDAQSSNALTDIGSATGHHYLPILGYPWISS